MTAPKTNSSSSSNSSNVRVVARIRPLSNNELKRGSKESITSLASSSSDDNKQQQHYEAAGPSTTECLQVLDPTSTKRFFELDSVFGPDSTQCEIYERSGAKLAVCQELFKGFNCTILAYGQTGAGKTFTMGTASASAAEVDSSSSSSISEMDGMIPRACADLFDTIQSKCDGNAKVELSYLEIYNEEIRDLMSSSSADDGSVTNSRQQKKKNKKLVIRERLNGEVYVQGVEYRAVSSPAEIGAAMNEASQRRVVASTAMNAVSSRSHAICTLRITGKLENDDQFSSKLTLVDLAGSERIKKTNAAGSRRQEGININKGLFVLGQVVSALSDAGRSNSNGGRSTTTRKPPYRDSKLTRLLQDSLGGNSRTIMVACCSPADYNVEESINTLRYATSARNIRNTATSNLVKTISPEEAAKLARENQLLKKQVAELQAMLEAAIAAAGGGVNDGDGGERATESTVISDEQQSTASTAATSETESTATSELNDTNHCTTTSLTATAAAVEVPALHMEVETLKRQLSELSDVEAENAELRQQLSNAQTDAEAARAAAAQLSDIMEKIREIKEDAIEKKRIEYRHKQREEKWIVFIFDLMQQQGRQLVKLWHGFEFVQRLVTQPISFKVDGNGRMYTMRPKVSASGPASDGSGKQSRWWDSMVNKGEYQEEEQVFVDDPDAYQMELLKEYIDLYKQRMRGVHASVQKECNDLSVVKQTLHASQQKLLAEIGNDELLQEAINKESNVLDQLTTMLLQPATVLAAQVPNSVCGGENGGGGSGASSDRITADETESTGEINRKGWFVFHWRRNVDKKVEAAARLTNAGNVTADDDESTCENGSLTAADKDTPESKGPDKDEVVGDDEGDEATHPEQALAPDSSITGSSPGKKGWFSRWRHADDKIHEPDAVTLAAAVSKDLQSQVPAHASASACTECDDEKDKMFLQAIAEAKTNGAIDAESFQNLNETVDNNEEGTSPQESTDPATEDDVAEDPLSAQIS